MQIAIELLDGKMQEIIAGRERSHSKQFATAAKQVMKSLESVLKAARSLAEAIKRAWGSLSRAAEQHGTSLSQQVAGACESLTAHTPGISYEELREFEDKSLQVARHIAKAYNKYAGSVIRSAKPEVSILENSITRLTRSVSELSQVLDRSNLKQLQLAAREADQLVRSASELHLKVDQIRKSNDALREAREREARSENDLSQLSQDPNLKELSRTEQLAQQKEADIMALFEPLSKAFRKADRPDSTSSTAWNQATVSKLAENPLAAMLEIPVTEIHEVLGSLRRLIEHDELFLDQRRKRKSIEVIQVLESGALERYKEDYSILQANCQEILRQLKASGIYDKWMSMRNQLDNARARAGRLQGDIANLQSQETRLRTHIHTEKAKIEATLQEILKEQVSIIVSF
jgi:predicted  nucleic acid-binding Zn-ribbon protein